MYDYVASGSLKVSNMKLHMLSRLPRLGPVSSAAPPAAATAGGGGRAAGHGLRAAQHWPPSHLYSGMAAAAARALHGLLPALPVVPLVRSGQACIGHIGALTSISQTTAQRRRVASMTPHQAAAAAAAAEQQQAPAAAPLAANPALAHSEVLFSTSKFRLVEILLVWQASSGCWAKAAGM